MTIGIDVDDVITDSSELITEYAKEYFGIESTDLVNKILHAKGVDNSITEFYSKYLTLMATNYKLKENVKEVIDRLRLKGHKIIIITYRGYGKYSDLIQVTKDYFKRHEIFVDKVIFKQKNKKDACLKEKLDIMIDDSVDVLDNLKETNIKPILFTSISNKNFKTEFDKVSNWLELEKVILKDAN